MSKKTEFPVMSPMISGVLYTLAAFLILLRAFIYGFYAPTIALYTGGSDLAKDAIALAAKAEFSLYGGLLGFPAVFLIVWALTSLCLHPAVEPKTRLLFIATTLILLTAVLSPYFKLGINVY